MIKVTEPVRKGPGRGLGQSLTMYPTAAPKAAPSPAPSPIQIPSPVAANIAVPTPTPIATPDPAPIAICLSVGSPSLCSSVMGMRVSHRLADMSGDGVPSTRYAPVAQGIEHRSPEPGAQVRVLPGAPSRAPPPVAQGPRPTALRLTAHRKAPISGRTLQDAFKNSHHSSR